MNAPLPTPEELDRQARAVLSALQAAGLDNLANRDRLKIPAQAMPAQAPEVRRRNTGEVALGYSESQARLEALRCLQCRNAPCVAGCPVRIDIPGFIRAMAAGDFAEAIAIIKRNSLLPSVCGRVCPQESQCQQPCTVGKALKDVGQAVSIGRLERFAADRERSSSQGSPLALKPDTGRRVAVIGSGPAGITVAADVRREGHAVTMFEAFHKPGGVLMYGIPEFRLPKEIVRWEIEALASMGVVIRTNFVVGRTRGLLDLMEKDGFDAVFVGSGAGLPKFMDIPGENLVGVYSANEYLTRCNLMRAYETERADTPVARGRRVAVLGGGNVAMDAARTAIRLGAESVVLVYRRTRAEMPARVEEVEHAEEEGVELRFLVNAQRILGNEDGLVREMECLKYELGAPDDSGRRRPVPIPDSEFNMTVDTVIVAIGNESNPLIRQTTTGLETNRWGNLVVDENGRTSLERVFAGGDIVLGAATVILAMGEGRRAAQAINRLLSA